MASIRFIPGRGYRIEWHVTVRHGPYKGQKKRGSQLIRCKQKTQFYRALALRVQNQREKEAAELAAGITKPVVPWDKFLEEYQREKQHQKTIEIAVKRLIELGEFAGFKTVNEFTGAAITRYIDHKRKAGAQPPTVRKILNEISAAMTYANNKKYLADHPFRTKEIQQAPKSKPRDRFLTRDDFAKFLRTCRSMPETGGMTGRDREYAMQFAWHCIFIINTGLRITEYIAAKKTELYPDRITVHGKGKRGQLKKRTVPFNIQAKRALKHLTQNQTKEDFSLSDIVVVGIINEKDPAGVFNPKSLAKIFELTQFAKNELRWADEENPDEQASKEPEKNPDKELRIAPTHPATEKALVNAAKSGKVVETVQIAIKCLEDKSFFDRQQIANPVQRGSRSPLTPTDLFLEASVLLAEPFDLGILAPRLGRRIGLFDQYQLFHLTEARTCGEAEQ